MNSQMKQLILLLLTFTLIVSCKKGDNKEYSSKSTEKTITKRLEDHFSRYRIEPKIVINNADDNKTEISFLGHKISWMDLGHETRFIIDDKQFSLKDEMMINEMINSQRLNVDLANSWEQIKLYNLNDSDIISVKMNYSPCMGTGCSVDYYLVYNAATKTTNYFGSYGVDNTFDNGFSLYNFEDGEISLVSKSAIDEPEIKHVIYELYSIDDKGKFQIRKKPNGKKYTIEERFKTNDDSTSPIWFKQDWIIKIK